MRKYLVEADLIDAAKLGSEAGSSLIDMSADQLRELYKIGKAQGPESPEEFRIIVGQAIMDNESVSDLTLTKRLEIFGFVDSFVNTVSDAMVSYSRARLGDYKDGRVIPQIEKWNSGFEPLDLTLGGLYQGLLVLVARPGGGKTSTMITLAGAIKQSHPDWQIWFFEQEIPENLMLARMAPVIKKNGFTKDDVLITGGLTIDEITEELKANGSNKNKVVIIDSPDTMPGLSAENRRFELGHIYRQLVRIKEQSQLVVVASQPRRKDRGNFTLESLAESWEKAWLADMVIGLWPVGGGAHGRPYKMKSLKNRFGIFDVECTYKYDLFRLEWEDAALDEDWSNDEDDDD